MRFTLMTCFLFASLVSGLAQEKKAEKTEPIPDPPLAVASHRITVAGKPLAYTSTTGYMILRDDYGKARAKIFFVYYKKDGVTDPSTRPITFSFNGGPGSASMWVHMGTIGPKRIALTDFGDAPVPPYQIVDNDNTWLDETDLIFIDPVMTGYSRPADGVDKKEFTGYEEDIEAVGQFIHKAVSRFERWNSPKFIAGESYGTTRATGLSGYLQKQYGMYLNGIALISSILNFETARFQKGNDLPYALFLPTYSAIAWYQKQLSPEYKELKPLLAEVEKFALGEYSTALLKGDALTDAEKQSVVDKLSKYTGLDKEYIIETNYRIQIRRFVKELRRDEDKTVGRLDGRFTSTDYDAAGENYEFDPADAAITGPFGMAINDYVRRTLKYENDLPYIMGGQVRPWNYNNVQNQYLNTSETLREAMHMNPYLKVHIFNGYYDLATPYFATDYTVNHMFVDESLRGNISQSFYEAGHMMYIHKASREQMKKDAVAFIRSAVQK